ncbi:hypothetical protein P8452_39038 [Trifolium repens]|nr:hypothetical protein P8452_39038 [Trifolium repens]
MTKPHTLVAKLYKARWRIGDGKSIKIMNEPWLRGLEGAWIPSPQEQGKIMHASPNEDWSSLWNIVAPPKTKHLLWRFCKGCVPTPCRVKQYVPLLSASSANLRS